MFNINCDSENGINNSKNLILPFTSNSLYSSIKKSFRMSNKNQDYYLHFKLSFYKNIKGSFGMSNKNQA